MRFSGRTVRFLTAALFLTCSFATCGLAAFAQSYTKIVVFGDSLSDTGNDAAISKAAFTVNAQVPGPATGYTDGRFTDGTDTVPAAHNYFGVWLEQLAAMLPAKPAVLNSLAGGTNYAYGFATTDMGTSTFTYGPGNALSFKVNNMGQQVSDYLATHPTIDNKTLFIVWGGANDLINATSAQDIANAAQRDAGIVQTLINAGATEFLIPNLPPLGLVPRFNGSAATSTPATQAAAGFDQALALYLGALPAANSGKTLHLYQLDTYTLFNTIVAAPSNKGFANVTMSAQGNSTINPDTYLFWDDLHPTTYGHDQLALAAFAALSTPVTTTTTLTTTSMTPNLGASVTFTAQVTSANGPPMGTLTILDGSNVLKSSVVTGTTTQASLTYTTTSLTAGTHAIQATFTGVNGFTSSAATPVNVVVTAPALTTSINPTTLNVASGSTGTVTVTFTPVGGYTGTATLACGVVPVHVSCSFSPSSVTLSGNNAQVTSTLTVGTSAVTALQKMELPGASHSSTLTLASFVLPACGLLGWTMFRRRRSFRGLMLTALVLLGGAAMLGTTGCGNSNNAAKGTYTVPISITVNGTTSTQNLTVNVQ